MNRMISIVRNSLIAILLLTGITVSAQHKTAEQKAKNLTDTMSSRLSLNEDQYKKVYDANLNFVTKASSLKKEDGDKSTKLGKIRSLNNERDATLKTILSDEQYNQFKAFKKENKKGMKGRLRKKA